MADRVANMVCPLCARLHGQEHADGCPSTLNRSYDYLEGWIEARDALLAPFADHVRALEGDVDALVTAAAQLCGRERDGTWVVYGDEHGDAIREHLLPVVRRIVERARG